MRIDSKKIPTGWTVSAIEDIADVNPRLNKSEIPDKLNVSFVPMPAVGAETGSIDVSEVRSFKEVKKGFTAFQEGDVLFAKITPCMENGKMAIVPKVKNGLGFGSTEFHVLRPKEGIDARYIYYYVSSKTFRGEAERYMTGAVGQRRVTTPYLKECEIPIAPLEQQKRIVAEIEKQFSRLDEAVANLKRVKANLKRYKAAVLKAAVEGKLTEEWRKQHPDVEPASKLLERILTERRQKWEEAELAKMKAKGKTPKDDKWKKKYKVPKPLATRIALQQLPVSWAWVTVDQIGTVGEQPVLTGPFGSNLGKSDFKPSGVPVLTIGCLQEEGILLNKAVFITEKKAQELAKYKLTKGDMLFSRMAAVGRAGFITEEFEGAIFNYHIMRLRLAKEAIDPNYYLSYVRGARSVTHYVREVNHGATRDGINTDQLLSMPVALPPNEEQEQIVREVEARLSVVNQIDNEVDSNLKRAIRLQQSILSKAFSGGLFPYNPC